MPFQRTLLLGLFAIGAVGVLVGLVHAQPARPTTMPATRPVVTDPRAQRIGRIMDDLAHADAAVRERALGQMLRLRRSDLPVLRDVVRARRPLAPTQAEVLHDIVVHVYLVDEPYEQEGDIGFLGINGGQNESVTLLPDEQGHAVPVEPTGVPVGEPIPGFGAFAALRRGDVVLGLGVPHSIPMSEWNSMTMLIQQLPPGQTITLDVLRQGQVITVSLTVSARPLALRDSTLADRFLSDREDRAEAYWTEHFAPLLGEPVS